MNAFLVCAPSGLGSATANQYREGIQIRGTGSCERGLCRGLSRMKGNFHVRFLAEVVAVMPLPYPTSGSNAASLPDLSCGIMCCNAKLTYRGPNTEPDTSNQ